ncbi:hypothetical protein ACFL3Y_01370 [Pseudomonadota bacterium]
MKALMTLILGMAISAGALAGPPVASCPCPLGAVYDANVGEGACFRQYTTTRGKGKIEARLVWDGGENYANQLTVFNKGKTKECRSRVYPGYDVGIYTISTRAELKACFEELELIAAEAETLGPCP